MYTCEYAAISCQNNKGYSAVSRHTMFLLSSTDRVLYLTDPVYLEPQAERALVKLPEGISIPLGASGSEDALIVSLHRPFLRSIIQQKNWVGLRRHS